MKNTFRYLVRENAGRVRRKIRDLFRTSDFFLWLLVLFYKGMCKSLRYKAETRVKIAEQDEIAAKRRQGFDVKGTPIVICLWHDELFPLIYLQNDLDIVCIVSDSKDGTIK